MVNNVEVAGAKTGEVFSAGSAVHLRIRFGGLERMVPVTCRGLLEPDNLLVVRWSEDAAARANPPRPNQELQFYTLVNGVLYVVQGRVATVGDGTLPEIQCHVDPTCLVKPLRRHQRYQVQGQVLLGEADVGEEFDASQPLPMDLSLGGFGVELPAAEFEVSQELPFALKLWVDDDGRAAVEHPVLELSGHAVIRNLREDELGGTLILGLEFTRLAALQMASLQMWIAAHVSFLREA
jgi:hypothetical protein